MLNIETSDCCRVAGFHKLLITYVVDQEFHIAPQNKDLWPTAEPNQTVNITMTL